MNKPDIELATLEFLGVCVLLGFTQWGTLSWGTFTPSRLPKPRLQKLTDEFGGSMKMLSGGVLRAALGNSLRTNDTKVLRASPVGLGKGIGPRLAGAMMIMTIVMGLVAAGARAQDVASITGTVTDKTGSAVFDASVRLIDTRTGAVYESRTGSFGAYLFARVPAGQGYALTVSKDGFKTTSISKLALAVTETATYD